MKLTRIISMIAGVFCTSLGCCNAQDIIVISPVEFNAAVENDANGFLLDVRKADEYAEGHLKGATLLNWLDEENFKLQAGEMLDKSKTIYLYCRSGRRSNAAATYLAREGYSVVDMKGGILAWGEAGLPVTTYHSDVFFTEQGRRVVVTFIKHGTLLIEVDGYAIHIDPVLSYGDYSQLPKADLLLVTHEHGDHYDKNAVAQVSKEGMIFLSNGKVAELSGLSTAMIVGDSRHAGPVKVTATAAYNNTPGHENFHPKGRDVGFLLDIDDLRIYVAGDTEVIPELSELKDIDIAFLPVNQPYTMTPEQCIEAIGVFAPKIVYPYHYSKTDIMPLVEQFKGSKAVEIRVRQLQ